MHRLSSRVFLYHALSVVGRRSQFTTLRNHGLIDATPTLWPDLRRCPSHSRGAASLMRVDNDRP